MIGIAQDAADRTKTAYEKESNLSEIKIGNKTYNSIEDYVYGEEPKLEYTVYGKVITIYLADSYYGYLAKKGTEELEAELKAIDPSFDVDALASEAGMTRREFELMLINELGVQTWKEVLITICLREGILGDEYLTDFPETLDDVTVTAPDGTKHNLSYIEGGQMGFTYSVPSYGNYDFIATNTQGRTSQLTVPVEIQMGNFTLWDEYEDKCLGTFSFQIGSTWEDFVGKEEITVDGLGTFTGVIKDGVIFNIDRDMPFACVWDGDRWTNWPIVLGHDYTSAHNLILDAGVYYLGGF